MSRTFKDKSYRPYNKENKEARKRTNRSVRKRNKMKIQDMPEEAYCLDDYLDDVYIFDLPPHTEGHETH